MSQFVLSFSSFLLVTLVVFALQANAGIIDDTKNLFNSAKSEAEKALNSGVSVCLTNDNCNQEFFKLNNYCCAIKCCNWFEYVNRNDNQWENFKETINQPRAINILIFVIAVVIISSILSILISFICCFFGCSRCCCGSRKYSIVSH